MADNIDITPGTGKTVATDDVTGIQFQVMKIGLGLNGIFREFLDYGQNIMASGIPVTIASDQSAIPMVGNVGHDVINSGNPILNGTEAISHGANPTPVGIGDRTKNFSNRHGIPFQIGGHPNIITAESATTGALTDVSLQTVAGGTKIVVTQAQVLADNANTAFPQVRIGFGAANTPTASGVILTHPGLPAGGGVSRGDGHGILGIGADGEDLRVTCASPTGGSLRFLLSYFLIES